MEGIKRFICRECGHNSESQQFHASHIRKHHRPIQIFNKLKFEDIEEDKSMTIDYIKQQITEYVISKNRINPSFSNIDVVIKKGLFLLVRNIKGHTNFLPNESCIRERVYCLMNNIIEYPKCKCGEDIKKINKVFNLYCSQSCSNKYTNYEKSEEFYKKVGKKISITRGKMEHIYPLIVLKTI